VTFAGQSKAAVAAADGKWTVKLDPLPANANPQNLEISSNGAKVSLEDVLVGEVWMCSGQSNMGFQLNSDWNGDLEAKASKLPNLRLIKVPQVWHAGAPERLQGRMESFQRGVCAAL
jgi:sialate O-acetylesterase